MLDIDERGIEIVMCSGTGPVPDFKAATSASAHHHDHHADHHSGARSDSGGEHTPCPYAVAGSACVTVAWVTPATPDLLADAVDFHSDAARGIEPFLLDRIRGPPLA
jgi:hypothetical protein